MRGVRAMLITFVAVLVAVLVATSAASVATSSAAPVSQETDQPSVAYLSTDAIELTADSPVRYVRFANVGDHTTSVRVELEPVVPEITLESGCETVVAATPVTTAPPQPSVPPSAQPAWGASLVPDGIGCVAIRWATAPKHESKTELVLVGGGTTQRRAVSATATPAAVVPGPKKLAFTGALDWSPGWFHLFKSSAASTNIGKVPVTEGSVGFVDGPDGHHVVTASKDAGGNGVLTVSSVSEAGAYTGTIDLLPGKEGGDVELTANYGLRGGPPLALALLVIGIILASVLAHFASKKLPSLRAQSRIYLTTANALLNESVIRRALVAAYGADLTEERWNRWRLIPMSTAEVDDPTNHKAEKLFLQWAATDPAYDQSWSDDIAEKVEKQQAAYQTAVNAAVVLAERRSHLAGVVSDAVAVTRIHSALFDPLPGGDAVTGLLTRVTAVSVPGLDSLIRTVDEYPKFDAAVSEKPQAAPALSDLKEAVHNAEPSSTAEVDAAVKALKAALSKDAVQPPAQTAALEAIERIAGAQPGPPSSPDSPRDPRIEALISKARGLRDSQKKLGRLLIGLSFVVIVLLGFKTTFIDVDGWGSAADVITTFTWSLTLSGGLQLARYIAPMNKILAAPQ